MRYCSRIGWRCMSMGRPCYLHQSLCCSVMRSAHLTQLIVYIGICSCSTSLFEHFSKRLQNMPACKKILARLLCCRKRQAWLVETAMHAGRSAALLTSASVTNPLLLFLLSQGTARKACLVLCPHYQLAAGLLQRRRAFQRAQQQQQLAGAAADWSDDTATRVHVS